MEPEKHSDLVPVGRLLNQRVAALRAHEEYLRRQALDDIRRRLRIEPEKNERRSA